MIVSSIKAAKMRILQFLSQTDFDRLHMSNTKSTILHHMLYDNRINAHERFALIKEFRMKG